jgi:hypothetical protein
LPGQAVLISRLQIITKRGERRGERRKDMYGRPKSEEYEREEGIGDPGGILHSDLPAFLPTPCSF